MRFFLLLLVMVASPAWAEIVVPVKTIRANSVLMAEDLATKPGTLSGVITEPGQAIGMETRVVLYAGRPIRLEDISEPAVVRRNQIVSLIFKTNGLSISTAGRALDRGAVGDVVRVMNLSSRTTLFGLVLADGRIDVSEM